MARHRIGIWIIGARGGVSTTLACGLIALKKKLCPSFGLVSELPRFANLDLVEWRDIAIGGHEIRSTSLFDEARQLHEVSRVIDENLLTRCKTDLQKIDGNIRPGTLFNVGPMIESLADPKLQKDKGKESPRQIVDRLRADMEQFAADNKLDQVIVLNLSSTEPVPPGAEFPSDWASLKKTLRSKTKCQLPASSIYAIAALESGFPYVNFTPSLGSSLEAIQELAIINDTCHMGHDGKTGETLMKSALAPMFAYRHLNVMSWVGHNIFGNMDGKVLDDPRNKQTKVASKDRLLHQILGYSPQTLVGIEYIESLGDWKTAWDHIHFQGFLGTPMVLQFTWQGSDSILAAPLALDLVRFTDRAYRNGDRGLLEFLSSFFKSPIGVEENDFVRQFEMLESWADEVSEKNA